MKVKLLTVLVSAAFSWSVNAYSQGKLNIIMNNVTVAEVFHVIEEKSDYILLYNEQFVDVNRKVSVSVKDGSVEAVLDQILKGTKNSYKVYDRQIVIVSREKSDHTVAEKRIVKGNNTIGGKITDEKGEPLPYANIVITHAVVDGSEIPLKYWIGVSSDLEGNYIFQALPDGRFVIKVLYVGYKSKTFQVAAGAGNRNVHRDVSLEQYSHNLEKVIVTSQAKGQMTAINRQLSSIAITNMVSPDRIRQNPDANAAEALGRLPGITVTREGGEANNIIIRGMPSSYNNVTLNGTELPAPMGDFRVASLAGISQYALQEVEVYKSITPDMDANAVAGSVNLVLRTAPDSFTCSIMALGGYNAQNKDFGNYKIAFNLGDRFFNNKLGVDLNFSTERTNRSTQKLDASYDWESGVRPEGEFVPLYNTFIGLTNVSRIVHRTSGTLVLDYRFSPRSHLQFSNFFAYNPHNGLVISKTYLPVDGQVFYDVNQTIGGRTNMYSGTLRGTHYTGKLKIEYGGAYTVSSDRNENRGVDVRSYQGFYKGALDQTDRSLPLAEIIGMARNEQTMENLRTYGLGGRSVIAPNFQKGLNNQNDHQYEAHFDLTIPFRFSDAVSADLKFGGQYKYKSRNRDFDMIVWHSNVFQDYITGRLTTGDGIDWTKGLEWVTLNDNNAVSMENMVGGTLDDFMGGKYIFGWYPDVGKINQIYDYWTSMLDYYRAQGQEVWEPLFGFEIAMGNILPRPSVAHDYSIKQNYYAGYVMSTISMRNRFTLVPGVRYEKVDARMKAWYVEHRLNETLEIPGYPTSAKRENYYFLPMIHLIYKISDHIQIKSSFTQTLNRPLFNAMIPYVFVDNAGSPFTYESGNPYLKPELWTSYDVSLNVHGSRIGLISVNGFYKKTKNKIWNRTWTRLAEDEPMPPFDRNEVVNVSGYYNHQYPVTVQGFEAEWQTIFWYLPKPFSYFTLSLNYSYIHNQTRYPWEEINIVPVDTTDRGRVIYNKIRVDSAYTGPMINQPSHLANVSLGFSFKGFDTWLSFQYIGQTPISLSGAVEKHVYKIAFIRWDLQCLYKLPVKGLDVLFDIANINNIQEEQYMRGDTRPIHVERYGWTCDFGIRYTF